MEFLTCVGLLASLAIVVAAFITTAALFFDARKAAQNRLIEQGGDIERQHWQDATCSLGYAMHEPRYGKWRWKTRNEIADEVIAEREKQKKPAAKK